MTTLKITGMTCDSCAVHVKEALEKVPGVQSAEVSYAKGSANRHRGRHIAGYADRRRGRTRLSGYAHRCARGSAGSGLLGKVREWLGSDDKAGRDVASSISP
jgi:mercuric reductase